MILHCPMCKEDPQVFCPRDPDAECLHCGEKLCGAHIGPHLKEVHCVVLNLDHCSTKETPVIEGGVFQRRVVKLDDFIAEAEARFGKDRADWKLVCPACKTVQSARDLVAAGVSKEDVDKYLGFSCIGRFTKDTGCDWTLGGLLQIHKLEIEDHEGKLHPHFELAPVINKQEEEYEQS